MPQQRKKQLPAWLRSLPFISMHLACLGILFTGAPLAALGLCAFTYFIRMFGITAVYHRYFAHRAYKTSRPLQFALACLGCSALQKGPLWWAAHHRRHHRYSDTEGDVHSPVQEGFWWSHIGWIVSPRFDPTDWDAIKDFSRYRELCLLNTWHLIPPVLMAVALFLV